MVQLQQEGVGDHACLAENHLTALLMVLEQKTQNTTLYSAQAAKGFVCWMSLDAHQNTNSYFLFWNRLRLRHSIRTFQFHNY